MVRERSKKCLKILLIRILDTNLTLKIILKNHRLPFDWKNPLGYAISVYLQLTLAFNSIRYIECFLIYGFAGLLLAFSIVKDIKNALNRFNKRARTKKFVTHGMKKLSKLIQLDVDLRVYVKFLKYKLLGINLAMKKKLIFFVDYLVTLWKYIQLH